MAQRARQFVILVLLPAIPQAAAQDQLGARAAENVDQAAAAYRAGRLGDALNLLEAVIKSATPDALQLADQRLRGEHRIEMSTVELAAFCRVELVLAGQGARLGRPPAAELPLALEALDDRIAFLIEPVRREIEIGMPAIVPDDVLTEKIDAIRPLMTTLDQVVLLQSHINQLASRLRAADRAQLDERPREIAGRKLPDEQKKLELLRDRVTSRLVDSCLVRLNNSLNTLVDERATFQNRFTATQKASESVATLHEHWDRYKRGKQRSGGIDPAIEQRWRRQEELVRIQAGALLQKAYHLDQGMRWWLRGRFGQGPLAGGLLKLVPAGMGQEQRSQWLVNGPLLMPRVVRKPQNPLTMPAAFPLSRRHLEIWRAESRVGLPTGLQFVLARPAESLTNTTLLSGPAPVPYTQVFSGPALETGSDGTSLARLVGYAEYAMALAHFDRLTELSTPAELRTFDDMIGQDDRFVVHSHLSAKFDGLDPHSLLRLPRPVPDPRAAHASERRGLAWAMALARVELGAMRAGQNAELTGPYGRFGDPFGAFDRWPPTPFDRAAFLEFVLDGGRQHYYETRTEYQVVIGERQPNFSPQLWQARLRLLQLGRKLRIGIEMIEAFRFHAGGSLTATQQVELSHWTNRMGQQEALILELLFPPQVDLGAIGLERPAVRVSPVAGRENRAAPANGAAPREPDRPQRQQDKPKPPDALGH